MTVRRMRLKVLVPILVLGVALALFWLPGRGSGESTAPRQGNKGVLLASSSTLPGEPSDWKDIAVLATNRRALRRTWRQFDLKGAPSLVDFDRRKVLFVGTGESGSCPDQYRSIERVEDRRLVLVHIDIKWGPVCTDDFRPRTFVVGAEKTNFPRGKFNVKIGDGKKVEVKRR
jgi:hypothetical protein